MVSAIQAEALKLKDYTFNPEIVDIPCCASRIFGLLFFTLFSIAKGGWSSEAKTGPKDSFGGRVGKKGSEKGLANML
jgi:hypothetical protein